MSNELSTQGQNQAAPFGTQRGVIPGGNVGAIAIEQERAVAEAQGQLILAKKFPRSMSQATAELMDACKSPDFAATAFYSVPNRGSGPSIRFAEEVARVYGNFQYGHRELSRTEGKSEIEVFAWDMEKNNHSRRQITVLHVVDTKQGPKKLIDQADIDNRIANVASKQMRGRIMALVPKHLVALGIAECKKTLAGDNDEPISARVTRMTNAFATKFGVNAAQLAAYLGHSLDDVTIDELADLMGVFNALKEGAKPAEYFNRGEDAEAAKTTSATADAIKATAAAATTKPAAEKPKAEKAAKASAEPSATQSGEGDKKAQASNAAVENKSVETVVPTTNATAAADTGEPAGPDEGDVF